MSTGKRGVESAPQSGKAGVEFHCDPPHCHWKVGVEAETKAEAKAKAKAEEAKAAAEKAHARPATASAIQPPSRGGIVRGTKMTRPSRRSRSRHYFTDRVMDFLLGDPNTPEERRSSHKSPLASSHSKKSVSAGGYSAKGRGWYEGDREREKQIKIRKSVEGALGDLVVQGNSCAHTHTHIHTI